MRLVPDGISIAISADNGALAGRYVFSDPLKPYLHPLQTPGGVLMSAFMPHDHKHHRALMYALRTPELNFWEERVTEPGEQVGRQVHRDLTDVTPRGESVGFTQNIDWCSLETDEPVLKEVRRIGCRTSRDGRGFAWRWTTSITAATDLTLRMSQWSSPRADGALVNYHGLGLRLPREFGGEMAKPRVSLDGVEVSIADAHGRVPRTIEFVSAADGYWPVRFGGVCFTQSQSNALFIMKEPFAFIALGPSNLAPRVVKRGETIEEDYAIEVFDAYPTGG